MRKLAFAFIPLMAVSLLTNCGGGKTPDDPSTRDYYKITTTVEGVTISAPTVKKGEDYVGKISVNSGVELILPDKLKSVILNDGVKTPIKEYGYVIDEAKKTADFTISKDYITHDVEVKLELKQPRTFDLKKVSEEYSFNPKYATEGKDYVGTIYTSTLAKKLLPNELGSVILADGTDITKDCHYTLAADKKHASFTIPKQYINSDITIDLTTHAPSTYTIYSEVEGIKFSPSTVNEGEKYDGRIEIVNGVSKILPTSLNSVVNETEDITSKCNYKILPNSYNRQAELYIPIEYVVSNIKIDLTLSDSPTFTVTTSVPNISLSTSTAYECCRFETEITVNEGVLKTLPEEVDWIKRGGTDIKNRCYYAKTDDRHATLGIFADVVIGNIEFSLTLSDTPSHNLIIASSAGVVTASPNVVYNYTEYNGTLTVTDENYILPESLDSVTVASQSNSDITEKCDYVRNIGSKTASLIIPAEYITAPIRVELTPKSVAEAKWYDYVEWWEYCSDGSSIQATEADIGKEVNVEVNDINHKVRLIDVDHDDLANGTGKAHCTFNFVDAIMDDTASPIVTVWHTSESSTKRKNYDYRASVLNNLLNNETDENSVINMFPEYLRDVIKPVSKLVGVYDNGQWAALGFGGRYNYPKLFPLAYNEIYKDSPEGVVPGEGEIYKYYNSDELSKDEYQTRNGGDLWLRSPCCTSDDFNVAYSIGYYGQTLTPYQDDILYECCIAPAFCI